MTSPAEELVLERAQRDLEEGLEYVRQKMRETARTQVAVLGRAMELGVVGAVSMLQLRPRYREDVHLLLNLAQQVNAGGDAEALARTHLPRVLRMRELQLVARTRDPAFRPLLDKAHGILAARLPDLARMVAVDAPKDYPELVTRAFPDPEYVTGFVRENRTTLLEIIAHLEENPRILRVPSSWVPAVANASRDIIDWETERVLASVHAMYGLEPPSPAKAKPEDAS